jgi:SAM-dependent methyltransferase
MNRVETAVVNSPPRRWLQRYEARLLHRLGGPVAAGRVLELGCGRGYGTRLILDRFGADPAMVARARRRLAPLRNRVRVMQGSATDLRAALDPDGSGTGGESDGYDAVFDFAIVHHVPDWRNAIAEVVRVLKPGGRFNFDKVTAAALATRGYRRLFEHPTEDRFTGAEFVAELERQDMHVGPHWRTYLRGHYLIGVAERPTLAGETR